MYGLIAKITTFPGKRDEMIALLQDSAANMPGCLHYVVAKDSADANIVWVTEIWESLASHDASLLLPQVKNVIPRAKAIVANFEKVAVTTPLCDLGRSAGKIGT
jgi:quinol monooxygenase YgiN